VSAAEHRQQPSAELVLPRWAHDLLPEAQRYDDRLRALVASSPVPIIGLDLEGVVYLWSPAAEVAFGYAADEVLGGPAPFALRSSDRTRTVLHLEDQTSVCFVAERTTRAGQRLTVEIVAGVVRDDHGVAGVIQFLVPHP
jgi:PAS domain S-box-containing protein